MEERVEARVLELAPDSDAKQVRLLCELVCQSARSYLGMSAPDALDALDASALAVLTQLVLEQIEGNCKSLRMGDVTIALERDRTWLGALKALRRMRW